METKEIWKRIKDYPTYEVSNKGHIRSYSRGYMKIMATKNRGKYRRLKLYNEGHFCEYSVHRLVLEAFVGPCPQGYETNHKDSNKLNNNIENLEWVTKYENEQHKHRMGRGNASIMFGERGPSARLKDGEIWLIKKLLSGNIRNVNIAKMFKVTPGHISHIKLGYTWKHINLGGI